MKHIFYLAICLLFANTILAQEKDYTAELKKDIVVIKDGKYTFDKIVMIIDGDNNTQFKFSASAPTTAISRDNFVYFTAITYEEITGDYETEELEELIGEPDVIVNIVMTKIGIQAQTTTNGQTERATTTWKQLLSED